MPTDNSVANPGQTGWWFNQYESAATTLYRERKHREYMEGRFPSHRLMRHEAKTDVHQVIHDKVKSLMQADGIEEGFGQRYLWKAVFGDYPRWLQQLIGSCVASGGMRACAMRSVAEIVLLGQPEETLGLGMSGTANINHFAPYSYRAGRKRGGINGGDGSFCDAHIEGLMEDGFLPCDTPGLASDAFPEPQSTSHYRQWGNSNSLLAKYSTQAREYDLLESERITSSADLREVQVEHFKPAMVCSNWAFRPDRQHPTWTDNGEKVWVYKRDTSTSWAHNMTKSGCFKVDGRWYQEITNSWGDNAHKNGDHFVIPLELEDQWLRSAEVRTIGDLANRDAVPPPGW
jgi:hypothetical protein